MKSLILWKETGFFQKYFFYDEILQRNSTGNQMVFCISTTAMSNQEEQKKS